MLAHHLGPRLRLDPAHGALYGTRRYLSAALRAKLRQSRPSASSTIRNSAERQPDRPAPAMSAVPAASAAGSAAAAASHAAGTPPQLEDLPLRFLARHRRHAASGLRQASSFSASKDGGGGAATEDGWRIAYRHWRQPVPQEQAPQATEGQVAGSSHGPGGRVASAAGAAVQPRPHTCVLFCNGLKSEMAGYVCVCGGGAGGTVRRCTGHHHGYTAYARVCVCVCVCVCVYMCVYMCVCAPTHPRRAAAASLAARPPRGPTLFSRRPDGLRCNNKELS